MINKKNGIPDFWITLFMTTVVRSYTHSTQRAYINHLFHLNLWEEIQGYRIADRVTAVVNTKDVSNIVFFSRAEIQSIASHCKFQTKVMRRKNNKSNKIIELTKPTSNTPLASVSISQQNQRIKVVAEYFEFIAHNALRTRANFSQYIEKIAETKQYILSHKSKGGFGRKTINPNDKAPSPEVFTKVMELVQPNHPKNPFTDLVKERNYLLFRILYETGLRSGEVLQLKVHVVVK